MSYSKQRQFQTSCQASLRKKCSYSRMKWPAACSTEPGNTSFGRKLQHILRGCWQELQKANVSWGSWGCRETPWEGRGGGTYLLWHVIFWEKPQPHKVAKEEKWEKTSSVFWNWPREGDLLRYCKLSTSDFRGKQALHFLRGTGKCKQCSREKMVMKGIVLCA